jgi:CHASE1-domain containing sensor protein
MLGHDLLTEPERRAAAQRAAETSEPAATSKVTLAAEAAERGDAGFLILGPLYRSGKVPETVEERNRDWAGFVYCSFVANNFFKALLTPQNNSLLNFRVYDGTEVSPANLMHDSGGKSAMTPTENALTATNTISRRRAARGL